MDEGGGLGAVRVPDGVGVTGAGDGEGWGRGRGVGAHFGGWVVACLVKWSKEGLGGVRNGMKRNLLQAGLLYRVLPARGAIGRHQVATCISALWEKWQKRREKRVTRVGSSFYFVKDCPSRPSKCSLAPDLEMQS